MGDSGRMEAVIVFDAKLTWFDEKCGLDCDTQLATADDPLILQMALMSRMNYSIRLEEGVHCVVQCQEVLYVERQT